MPIAHCNTTFTRNKANGSHGGSVAIEGAKTSLVDVQDCTFVNNTAPHGFAGALFIVAKSMDMSGTNFLNNTAKAVEH